MSAFYNLGSFSMGLVAWIVPVLAIGRYKKGRSTKNYTVYSFGLCAIALVFQLLEIKHRIEISDWSALIDTIEAIIIAAIVLVVITTLLNFAANYICRDANR